MTNGRLVIYSWICAAILASSSPAISEPAYPQIIGEIPEQFRGSWDEIFEDGCQDREPRFLLEGKALSNFEVDYDVIGVTLRSPDVIEVNSRLSPDFGGPVEEVWLFRLFDGQTLSAPDGKPPYYKRCPIQAEESAK